MTGKSELRQRHPLKMRLAVLATAGLATAFVSKSGPAPAVVRAPAQTAMQMKLYDWKRREAADPLAEPDGLALRAAEEHVHQVHLPVPGVHVDERHPLERAVVAVRLPLLEAHLAVLVQVRVREEER